MAKTVALSDKTHGQLEELKEILQKEMQLPVKVNQAEAVAIIINESYNKRKKKQVVCQRKTQN